MTSWENWGQDHTTSTSTSITIIGRLWDIGWEVEGTENNKGYDQKNEPMVHFCPAEYTESKPKPKPKTSTLKLTLTLMLTLGCFLGLGLGLGFVFLVS